MKKIISHLNNGLNFKHFILIAFLLAGFIGYGQTTLTEGDLALIGMDTGDEDFAFVSFVNLDAGTEIYFTDEEANNDYSIGGGEGTVLFTSPAGGITAGTVITYIGNSSYFSSTSDGDMELANGGDGIIAYQGSSVGTVSTFLHSIAESSTFIGTFPDGFSNYVLFGADDGEYNGTRTGNASTLMTAINNSSNWTTSGSGVTPFTTTPFSLSGISISNISNSPAVPTSSETVDVSADINDDGSISSANLNWGTVSGNLNNIISMSNGGSGNTYTSSSSIPAQSNNTTIYYEIEATDNNSNTQTSSEQSYTVVNPPTSNDIWINEIHYDNDGTDQNEFVEIALIDASNYTLSDFTIYLYNGGDNETYDSKTLNQFTVGTTYDNTTLYTYTYPTDGIQNGDSDGMAISWNDGSTEHLIQFLSYEGTITAINGPANMQTSVDIGVAESSSTTVGHSLQLVDGGAKGYSDYTWSGPAAATAGTENSTATDDQTLPIELTLFTAEKQDNFNVINWVTAVEENNAYFSLEKSFNAKDFFEIDNVKGAGNSKSTNYYQSKDFNTDNDVIYYRLKQTDFDGASTYSEIISIENSSELVLINNYFNGSEYVINLNSNNYNNININLYDINGRLIISESKKTNKGNNSFKFNVDNISKGVYLLNIQTKNSNINSKVFK